MFAFYETPQVDKFHFSVITVRLRWPTAPPSTGGETNPQYSSAPLEAVEKALEQVLRDEDDILVMGDFSRAPDDSGTNNAFVSSAHRTRMSAFSLHLGQRTVHSENSGWAKQIVDSLIWPKVSFGPAVFVCVFC